MRITLTRRLFWTRNRLLCCARALLPSIGRLLIVATPLTITATAAFTSPIRGGARHRLLYRLRNCFAVALTVVSPAATITATTTTVVTTATPIAIADRTGRRSWVGTPSRTLIAPSAIPFGPRYRLIGNAVVGVITMVAPTIMSTSMAAPIASTVVVIASATIVIVATPAIMAAIVPVPALPLVAPIAAVAVVHVLPATIIIEDIIAVAGIPETVIPAAAKADVVKAIAIVAVIIAIKLGIRIAVVIIVAIAIAGIAKAYIINATGQTNRG